MNGYKGKPISHILVGGLYDLRVITPVENGAYVEREEITIGHCVYYYSYTADNGFRVMRGYCPR